MSIANEPFSKSDEDSMPSLIGGDEDNFSDVEPRVQADHDGLARDAHRRRWTD